MPLLASDALSDIATHPPLSRCVCHRYSFNNNGQLNLVRYSTSDYGRHSFVTGGNPGGPNVFYRCSSTNDQADIGPHMRWAVGQLYDNIFGGQMRVWDRGLAGSGHGWSGNTIVFWNCHSLASLGALFY